MKSRSAWIVTTLIAGAAFVGAFFGAREMKVRERRPGDSGILSVVAGAGERVGTGGAEAKADAKTSPAVVESLYDEVLQRALAMPDLAEGIRHILAMEGIDYCAGWRLSVLVERLPASRLGELGAALDAQEGRFYDYVGKYVLGAWAQRDAAGALAFVEGRPGLAADVRESFVRGWMRGAPEEALAWVDKRPGGTGTAGLRDAVVEAMAETKPEAALALMKSRGWIGQYPNAVLKLMHNWGGADPQSALAGLRKLMAETGIAPGTGDPERKGIRTGSGARSWDIFLRALMQGAFDRSPAEAVVLASRFTPEEHAAGFAIFAKEVVSRDPDAAEQLFREGSEFEADLRPILLQVTEQSPSLALSNLHHLSDEKLRGEIVSRIEADPHDESRIRVAPEAQAAVSSALAGMKTGGAQRFQIAAELCRGNASTSPQWAAELWSELPEFHQQESSKEYFRGLAAGNPDLALTEFQESSREVQQSALRSLALGLSTSRPEEVLQVVLKSSGAPEQTVSAAALFSFWAQSDEAAALAALERHAGELDLKAVAGELKNAGLIPVPHGFEPREVPTAAVAEKINALLSKPAPPAR